MGIGGAECVISVEGVFSKDNMVMDRRREGKGGNECVKSWW